MSVMSLLGAIKLYLKIHLKNIEDNGAEKYFCSFRVYVRNKEPYVALVRDINMVTTVNIVAIVDHQEIW
jgi:hypothetical protein